MSKDVTRDISHLKLKISIIIPVYNSAQYLRDTVASILQQKFDNYEIILINDGSTDNSGNLCDELSNESEKIKVIHQKNGGICSARNTGLSVALGEYIAFCDNDDIYMPGLLHDNYELAKQYNADIVRFNRKRVKTNHEGKFETEINFMPSGVHFFQGEEIHKNYLMIRKCSVAVWSALYKREFIKKNKLKFDTRLKSGLEDRIFNLIAYRFCNRIVLNSKVYYIWQRRESHSTTDKFNMNIISSILYSIKVEKKTYDVCNSEFYQSGYWSNIIQFYLYLLFWNLNSKSCRLNFIIKIKVFKFFRNYIQDFTGLNFDLKRYNGNKKHLEGLIYYHFCKGNYFRMFLYLKIKDQDY